MRERHGDIVYRVPIDLGLGCPHRDIEGKGGCTFCPEDGSRANSIMGLQSVEEQVLNGIAFARQRYRAKKFMAYFQAYTSTFAPLQHLKSVYSEAMSLYPFESMTISTRPDCLPDSLLNYLKEWRDKTDLWIEVGVQSVHNETLEAIQRDHDWETSRDAIRRLQEHGFQVAAHIILGLPGETLDHFKQTITELTQMNLDGLKIHNLHVIQGTQMADQFLEKPFKVYNEHEYAEILLELLPLCPAELPIFRLTCDTEDDHLIAPRWQLGKAGFMDLLIRLMNGRNVKQGDHTQKLGEKIQTPGKPVPKFCPDGSFSFYNAIFKEHYHSKIGAKTEALEKYVVPSSFESYKEGTRLHLLDLCFGLGANSMEALESCLINTNGPQLNITALEIDRNVVYHAASHQTSEGLLDRKDCLLSLWQDNSFSTGAHSIRIHWGDARHQLHKIEDHSLDIIYHDPFSSQRCSELWTLDFFKCLAEKMKPDGLLLTYSRAIPILTGLHLAGFHIELLDKKERWHQSTKASPMARRLDMTVPQHQIQKWLDSTRGLPFRDPHLILNNKDILRNRENEIRQLKAQLCV